MEHDITEALAIDGHVDAVMDLESPASPSDFARIPLEVGSVGIRRLLDLTVLEDGRFFLASTSEVYGDPLVHPQPMTALLHPERLLRRRDKLPEVPRRTRVNRRPERSATTASH